MARSTSEPALARHIARWDWSELAAAAEAVKELQTHPGWRVVVRLLGEEKAAIDATLDSAREPLEQAQYAQLHGRRGALSAAEAAIDAVVFKHEVALQELIDKREPVGAGQGG